MLDNNNNNNNQNPFSLFVPVSNTSNRPGFTASSLQQVMGKQYYEAFVIWVGNRYTLSETNEPVFSLQDVYSFCDTMYIRTVSLMIEAQKVINERNSISA